MVPSQAHCPKMKINGKKWSWYHFYFPFLWGTWTKKWGIGDNPIYLFGQADGFFFLLKCLFLIWIMSKKSNYRFFFVPCFSIGKVSRRPGRWNWKQLVFFHSFSFQDYVVRGLWLPQLGVTQQLSRPNFTQFLTPPSSSGQKWTFNPNWHEAEYFYLPCNFGIGFC